MQSTQSEFAPFGIELLLTAISLSQIESLVSALPPDVRRGLRPAVAVFFALGCAPGSGSAPLLRLHRQLVSSEFDNIIKKESLIAHRYLISQDSPALYITLVTNDRLPVFRKDSMKEVLCRAVDEARKRFLLFAYVIMLDHIHLLTSRPSTTSEVLRVLKEKDLIYWRSRPR